VELGVSTAASVATAARGAVPRGDLPRGDAAQRAITEHILALADRAGYGAALIDAAAGAGTPVTTWPQFADTVRAAARGLSRRGLLDTDTVGVLVGDAVSHAVAIQAIRAAGAIAAPIGSEVGLSAAGTAKARGPEIWSDTLVAFYPDPGFRRPGSSPLLRPVAALGRGVAAVPLRPDCRAPAGTLG